MSMVPSPEERVLVLGSAGSDLVAGEALKAAGVVGESCADVGSVARELAEGAAAILLVREELDGEALPVIGAAIRAQPAWSDLPVVLLTRALPEAEVTRLRELLGNVTFVELPSTRLTLTSALQGAVRERHGQYLLRNLIARREEEVRQRDHFLAMLGHELRNPLASIIMAGDVMERSGSELFVKQRALISRQSRHLARLVDDLLDVSRVTTGRIVLRRSAVDLLDVALRGLQAADHTMRTQRILGRIVPGSEPTIIDGDPVRVEQIVSNLLANALKYTPANGRVEIQVAREGGDGVLRMRDTGCGIAPEMLSRVFDLFTQAESTLERAHGGLGIGLTVVRGLVQLHSGSVHISSEGIGQGTEVVVRLPLHPSTQLSMPPPVTAREVSLQRIVVVEDHEDYRELLQTALQELGHEVDVAADGLRGLALVLSARPDIAFVDIGLPGLDGYGIARQVREVLGAKIYLVALTGYGQPEDRQRALEAGFDVHLTKPLDFNALQKAVARARGARV